MSRGGVSYEGNGFHATTYKAGAGILALVAAAAVDSRTGFRNKDVVKGLAVVKNNVSQEVDLGSDGDTIFGFIDGYEFDGLVSVQDRGYRVNVPTVSSSPTVGASVAVDGEGKVKNKTVDTIVVDAKAGTKQAMIKKVTEEATTAGDVKVTITAAGEDNLKDGKEVTITVTVATAADNAEEIRAELANEGDVTDYFDVGGTGEYVILTKKDAEETEYMTLGFELDTAVGMAMGDTIMVNGHPGIPEQEFDVNIQKAPIFIEVDTIGKTATVFLG